jgi:hypothetical protein
VLTAHTHTSRGLFVASQRTRRCLWDSQLPNNRVAPEGQFQLTRQRIGHLASEECAILNAAVPKDEHRAAKPRSGTRDVALDPAHSHRPLHVCDRCSGSWCDIPVARHAA